MSADLPAAAFGLIVELTDKGGLRRKRHHEEGCWAGSSCQARGVAGNWKLGGGGGVGESEL